MNTEEFEISYAVAFDWLIEIANEVDGSGKNVLRINTIDRTHRLLTALKEAGYHAPELTPMGGNCVSLQWVFEYGIAGFEIQIRDGSISYQINERAMVKTFHCRSLREIDPSLMAGLLNIK